MKQTITTEIDIPDGYEFVRIGDSESNSEFCVLPNGEIVTVGEMACGDNFFFIVKPITKLIVGAPYGVWDKNPDKGKCLAILTADDVQTSGEMYHHKDWENWQKLPFYDYAAFEKSLEK